jgi:hypothetical protein
MIWIKSLKLTGMWIRGAKRQCIYKDKAASGYRLKDRKT